MYMYSNNNGYDTQRDKKKTFSAIIFHGRFNSTTELYATFSNSYEAALQIDFTTNTIIIKKYIYM